MNNDSLYDEGDFIMPKPYSHDLRIRVAREAAKGVPIRTVAVQYNVSPSFVWRMQKLFKDTKDVKPKQFGGYKRFRLAEHRDAIAIRINAQPSITLAELKTWLEEAHGVCVAVSTLDYFIRNVLRYPYKKNAGRRRT